MPRRSGAIVSNTVLPIVLDVEASGFGRGSYPIEVGIALPNGDLHAWLIKPLPEWIHWQESAEQIHGISRAKLERDGLSPKIVAKTLNNLLQGKIVYSDGWGVDRPWLALLFHDVGLNQLFKLETVYSLLTQAQMECWTSTRKRVIETHDLVPHRAGSDALIVQTTYRFLTQPPDQDAPLSHHQVA